jgi:hypothetical protein
MTKQVLPANQLPKIVDPQNLDQVLDPFADYLRSTFNCHRVGVIQSFNTETQRAVVQLVDVLRKNTFQGQQLFTPTPLVEVPVAINYGSNGGLNFPIKMGLECLVFFNDRDLENWKETGAIATPKTYRMHDMADGVCYIGIKSNPKAIASYDNTTVGITYLDDSGAEQAKVKVDDKVEIANNNQSLKDLIANLISILQNLKTVNGSSQYPIDATTSTNLSTLLTNFNQLLK